MTEEESTRLVTKALADINGYMRAACPKGNCAPTQYTQETHSALKTLIAVERVRSDLMEKRVAALEAKWEGK